MAVWWDERHIFTSSLYVEVRSSGPGQGESLELNGTDEYVQMSNQSQFHFNTSFDWSDSDFSITAWVKFLGSPANEVILSKGTAGNREFILECDAASKLRFTAYATPQGSTYRRAVGDTVLQTNTWYLLGLSYESVGENVASFNVDMFVDGAPETVTESTAGTTWWGLTDSLERVLIGRYNTSYSNIRVDDICFYNKLLVSADMTDVYNSGFVADMTTLTAANAKQDIYPYLVSWIQVETPAVQDQVGSSSGTLFNIDDSNFSSDIPGS